MIQISATRLALAIALTAMALAAAAGSAQAAVTATTISAPATNSYFFLDRTAPSSTLFTVTGTTTGSGPVDIDCYDGHGDTYYLVASVSPTDGSFSVPVTGAELEAVGLTSNTCALRAVPAGDTTDYLPGATSSFAGPVIALSSNDAIAGNAPVQDFQYSLSDFSGFMRFSSAGSCGLFSSLLYAAGTLTPSSGSFACAGVLHDMYVAENGATVGPDIQVDGAEALDAAQASPTTAGYRPIAVSESFSGGALTIHDDEPLMSCIPSCSAPTSYTSSGVTLDRTWQTEADGLIALQTDAFVSTDSFQHSLAVGEDDTIVNNGITTAIDFAGSSGFQDYGGTATVTLPPGAGTTYFKTDSATPDSGDGAHPMGAIVYTSSPSAPQQFTHSDENGSGDLPNWIMPYTRTIPAGGSVLLRFAYVQGYSLGRVQSLATSALMRFRPRVLIASPANGTTEITPMVTVSGTVSDPAGITGLTINGRPATLLATGAFSGTVALAPGANTITATAIDTDGLGGDRLITVTLKDPPTVTTGSASRVKARSAKIAGTVNPAAQATTYQVQYGTSRAYGFTSSPGRAGSGSTRIRVSRTLSGLKPATTYHYRVIATNASGATYGSDRTFRTGKPAPVGLGAKAYPRFAAGAPFYYTVKGKLSLPHGIAKKRGCAGTITIKVKHARTRIATAHARVTNRCTWVGSVTVTLAGHGKLRITPTFGGNRFLSRLTGKPLTVRYG